MSFSSKRYREFIPKPNTSEQYETGDQFNMEGSFISVRYQADDGFVIATFEPKKGESIVCKGKVPGFVIGAPYKIKGIVVNDKKWGLQVNIESAVAVKPSTESELIAFLGSGAISGIGPMTAQRIYKHFGKDTLHVLEKTPERLIEVKGIGEKSIKKMIKEIPNQLQYREVIGYFANFGISTTTINTLIRKYGAEARDIVEANPYVLCKVRGFAFSRADAIAMKIGIEKHDPNRIYAGALATLRWMCEAGGHTLIPENQLVKETKSKLSIHDDEEIIKAIDSLIQDGRVIKDEKGIHLKYLYQAEEQIKTFLDRASRKTDPLIDNDEVEKLIKDNEESTGLYLTEEQKNAIYNAVNRKISILAGTPGGGKAQPLYSKVLTAYGWKQMGELNIGDLVYTPSGTLSSITDIYERGNRKIWRIYTDDGRYAECCEEHLWNIKGIIADAIEKPSLENGWKTCELREIVDAVPNSSYQIPRGYLQIPATSPIEWLIGSTDGECEASEDAGDTITDSKMTDYISSADGYGRSFADELKHYLNAQKAGDIESIIADAPRIRTSMRMAHIEQRTAFLDAVIDNIGYIEKTSDGIPKWTLAFTSGTDDVDSESRIWRIMDNASDADDDGYSMETSANGQELKPSVYGYDEDNVLTDFLEIIRGLGYKAFVRKPVGNSDAIVLEAIHAHYDSIDIVSIESTDDETQMRCIMIDDPAHLYITNGYLPTHNTTACKIVTRVLTDADLSVCLISPTGRAAKRLSEACNLPGYTMHRALSIQVKQSKDNDFFAEDETSTFIPHKQSEAARAFKKAKVVLADEASMMDTEMAAILFKACKNKHLVLIGDPNQLPAVGCGRVLGDLIESSYSQGENSLLTTLTKVFRQAEGSPIIEAAKTVQQGKSPCYIKGIQFYECANDEVPDIMKKKVVPFIKKRKYGYQDYMIISPIKKTPYSGVNALNELLRPLLNDRYKKHKEDDWKLQPGDFVSQKKNNYEVDIFNGDIGVVSEVSPRGDVTVDFADASELIVFEPFEVNDNLMLAYASTVHRQQGSQAPLVVVVCTSSQFALLNRNMLYTAITRAETELILVGDAKAFAMAARNKKENSRMTGLQGL